MSEKVDCLIESSIKLSILNIDFTTLHGTMVRTGIVVDWITDGHQLKLSSSPIFFQNKKIHDTYSNQSCLEKFSRFTERNWSFLIMKIETILFHNICIYQVSHK